MVQLSILAEYVGTIGAPPQSHGLKVHAGRTNSSFKKRSPINNKIREEK